MIGFAVAQPKQQTWILRLMVVGILGIFGAAAVTFISITDPAVQQNTMGAVCVAVLIIFYSSPLSVLYKVISTRNSASLLWPLAVANVINGVLWTAYGFAIKDAYIYGPNGVGTVTSLVQLALCFIFPRKPEEPTSNNSGGMVVGTKDDIVIGISDK
ncbi:hypothetical protein HK102_006530 [Quaeritorhiza haematococci]|nr:hypothetical protein HK102_006530 [Quaeritorhiza haematococci]